MGDWKEAAGASEKALTLGSTGTNGEHFLLAMVDWQMGDRIGARRRYDAEVKRLEKLKRTNPKLQLPVPDHGAAVPPAGGGPRASAGGAGRGSECGLHSGGDDALSGSVWVLGIGWGGSARR
jgi:hypothetical protein